MDRHKIAQQSTSNYSTNEENFHWKKSSRIFQKKKLNNIFKMKPVHYRQFSWSDSRPEPGKIDQKKTNNISVLKLIFCLNFYDEIPIQHLKIGQ